MNEYNLIVDYLTRESLRKCAQQDIFIQRPLIQFLVKCLFLSKGPDLVNADEDRTSMIYESIYDQIIENGPVVRLLKLEYYFQNSKMTFHEIQEKYEQITRDKLKPLIDYICNFKGTRKEDHEEIFKKMMIYIVASNKLFDIKNSQMQEEARSALHSILAKQDIQDFLSRNKGYRMDFLDRLGKIMCGILLFNKHTGHGGEAIRDVIDDIHVAYQNTLESFEISLKNIDKLIKLGLNAVSNAVDVNLSQFNLIYKLPDDSTKEEFKLFNKFNYLHLHYEMLLKELFEKISKLKCQIGNNVGQLKEAVFKLQDSIKFRLATPSDLVYPYFTQLFEAWNQIRNQLYYLTEINKIKDGMKQIIAIEYPFEEIALKFSAMETDAKLTEAFEEFSTVVDSPTESGIKKSGNFNSSTNQLQNFCALTMVLSKGILLQSNKRYGFLPFQKELIAFEKKEYIEFVEKHYKEFINRLLETALKNPEISFLFKIPTDYSTLNFITARATEKEQAINKKKTFDTGIQTENCLPAATIQSRNTYSWNLWDYYRRAAQLANIKKCKTHSTQTNVTYSSRDAAIQTYNKISSTHKCTYSSSQ